MLAHHGFIMIAPEESGRQAGFNGGSCCGKAAATRVDDLGFFAAVVDAVAAAHPEAAREHVYGVGWSNGGFVVAADGGQPLQHRLFSAIALIAGYQEHPFAPLPGQTRSGGGAPPTPIPSPPPLPHPLPVLIHHSRDDPLVRFGGCCAEHHCCCKIGAAQQKCHGGVVEAVRQYAAANGCTGGAGTLRDVLPVGCTTLPHCVENVTLCVHDGDGKCKCTLVRQTKPNALFSRIAVLTPRTPTPMYILARLLTNARYFI